MGYIVLLLANQIRDNFRVNNNKIKLKENGYCIFRLNELFLYLMLLFVLVTLFSWAIAI